MKYIVEVNKPIRHCSDCFASRDDQSIDYYYCKIRRSLCFDIPNGKPDWCPLNEVQEPKPVNDDSDAFADWEKG